MRQLSFILRHTYRKLAHAAGILTTEVQLLMDHKAPGVTGVYLHDRALFDHLLGQQEKASSYILGLAGLDERPVPGAEEIQMAGED